MIDVINTINEYKGKSAVPLRDQQIAYIPRLEDQIEFTIPFYYLGYERVVSSVEFQIFIRLKYLKFAREYYKNKKKYESCKFNIKELVDNNIIEPFMIFVNGYFIPWDCIDIVMNYGEYTVAITANTSHMKELCAIYDYIQIVSLPYGTAYTDNYMYDYRNALFAFNKDGLYDTTNIKYAFYFEDGINKEISFNHWTTPNKISAFPLLLGADGVSPKVKITEDNVFLFTNGLFTTGELTHVGRAYNSNAEDIRDSIKITTSSEVIELNPDMRIDGTLLTVGKCAEELTKGRAVTIYDFSVFVNSDYTDCPDNILSVNPSELSKVVYKLNEDGTRPPYFNNLKIPFKMEMSMKKPYDENVMDCIKTIMKYNPSIFNKVIEHKSNLIIKEYTGDWVISHLDTSGNLIIPVCHSDMNNEAILLFVNGELYSNMSEAYYTANKCVIPINNDIESYDIIELFRFQNINNYEFPIVIEENNDFSMYDDSFINENMSLFTTEINHEKFPNAYQFPEDGIQHFEVGYKLDTSNGSKKIILDDPFYYGKHLTLANKNRFVHYSFSLNPQAKYDEFSIDLGDAFKYCNDYSKYMVFVNGRKMNPDHYRLVLPVRETLPFYNFKIYLSVKITTNTKLDIIYSSNMIQDTIVYPKIDTSGDIVVDRSLLDYSVSTNLFMIWLNGKKVPASHITDIGVNKMRVMTDEHSTNSLCVTKYIPGIDILDKEFDANSNIWESIINNMTDDEISKLLGVNKSFINDYETKVFAGAVNAKTVMHELIRDQFMANPFVASDSFVYNYTDVDTSAIAGYDSAGNAIFLAGDGEDPNNISEISRIEDSIITDNKSMWIEINGKYRYLHKDGSYSINKWEEIDGYWYLFDDEGFRITGWYNRGNATYYFNEYGQVLSEWQIIDGNTYYFNPSFDGRMQKQWLNLNNYWYYFGSDGIMKTGWVLISTKYYYFDTDTGIMATNKWIGDRYVGPDGAWDKSKK